MKNTQYYRQHSLLRIFLSYFRPHLGLFTLDIACATVASLIDLAFPLLSRYAINSMLPAGAFRLFFTVMGIMAAAYALHFAGVPIVPLFFICQMVDIGKCVIGLIMIKKGMWIHNIVKGTEQ